MPGISAIPAFSKNTFDVTMVVIEHCSIADAIASGPAVKFKFTGTDPAIVMPMFASAPPHDDGSSTPTFGWFNFFAHRDTMIEAVNALPYVSSRPVESAIANRDQFFLAARMHRK